MSTKEILNSLRTDFMSSVDLYFKPVTAVAREFRKAVCEDDSAGKPSHHDAQRRSAPPSLKVRHG
jgi:hypothetical protein